MLSFKDKFHLLRNFLDLRANPHKNRIFQYKKTMFEESKSKNETIRLAKQKQNQLEKAIRLSEAAAEENKSQLRQSPDIVKSGSPFGSPSRRGDNSFSVLSKSQEGSQIQHSTLKKL